MSPPSGRSGRGLFLTFEGTEGSGKSTQIGRLLARLRRAGIAARATREPGGSDLGQRLRAILLDSGGRPPSPMAELLLYSADRAEHLHEIVLPALAAGEVVLCDRYLDATLAYQGYGRGLPVEAIRAIHSFPPLDLRPDRTVLLDVDPGSGLSRAIRRNHETGLVSTEGRFEGESLEFHRRVREGYLALAAAEPGRFRLVAGDEGIDQVEARVARALLDLLPALGVGRGW